MSDSKKCFVEGCDEPRFKHFARCHAHQQEEWRRAKLAERQEKSKWQPKTPEQKEAHLKYHREYQANRAKNMTDEQKAEARERLRLHRQSKRGTCDVEGCESPRFGKHNVCRAHNHELKKAGATIVIAPKREPILADFPNLVAIHTRKGKYVVYKPVEVIEAVSKRSLEGTRKLLSSLPSWIVVEDGDGEAK